MAKSKRQTSHVKHERVDHREKTKPGVEPGAMKRVCGFDHGDLTSWNKFISLMNQPRDPACLAAWRIMFGILMIFDLFVERGFSSIDEWYGDPTKCFFPLFSFLAPLPVDWMYLVYIILLLSTIGITLGLFYRLSCLVRTLCYWYIFLLNKDTWNNHSYLYGLISFLMIFVDGNRMWSLDSLMNPGIRNNHVPLWNYALLRLQVFLVYFIAGLKKLDMDWVQGYSMEYLSEEWVFDPFRLVGLTDPQIDFFIVHLGGLTLDLTAGFLLFFDLTRIPGAFFISSFHIMNSQLFHIGMFPYTMLATTPLFFYPDWPRKFIRRLPQYARHLLLGEDKLKSSYHCIYSEQKTNVGKNDKINAKNAKATSAKRGSTRGLYHSLGGLFFILFASFQLFLPYSHFVTKGYNNWTNGLYGYSWDMMVHTWNTQHIKLQYYDRVNNKEGYLSPMFWSTSRRWISHADMVKQYAMCVADRVQEHGIQDPALYLDVWLSMNGRFQQRIWNPTTDLVKADWSPFQETPWLMPLLTDLSDWRTKLSEIEQDLDESVDVTFVADFPGLRLENFVPADLGNTTLHVLSGKVVVEIPDKKINITLEEGDMLQLPVGAFHYAHTVSATPSCYMYWYINTTEKMISEEVAAFMTEHNITLEDEVSLRKQVKEINVDPLDPKMARILKRLALKYQEKKRNSVPLSKSAMNFISANYDRMHKSLTKSMQALNFIFLGGDSVVSTTYQTMEQSETEHSSDSHNRDEL